MSEHDTSRPLDEDRADPAPRDDGSAGDARAVQVPPRRTEDDPLRGSRTSGIWAAVVALVVLLVLLAIFVLQNTQRVEVSFLGWTGHPPLAAALLIATAGGALVAVVAGALRLLQLRRRVRRDRKHTAA
jgi:uncharacterized integral membrane protein